MNRLIVCGLMAGAVLFGFASCDSSDQNHGGSAAGGLTAAGNAAATSVTISSTQGSLGTYLVDGAGKSLYAFDGDQSGTSNCTGQCAQVWPPLIEVSGQTPTVTGQANSTFLGTITRADGSTQVTYNGLPLYYYSQDHAPGDTNGEGANSYGGQWWLVSTDGSKLTQTSSSSPTEGVTGVIFVGGICNSNGQCCDLYGNCYDGLFTCDENGRCCDTNNNCYTRQASCDANGRCCDSSGHCFDNGPSCDGYGHCCDQKHNCYDNGTGGYKCDSNGHCCDANNNCYDRGHNPVTGGNRPEPTGPTGGHHPGPTGPTGGRHPGSNNPGNNNPGHRHT